MDPHLWDALAPWLKNPIVLGLVLAVVTYLFVSKRLAQLTGPLGALARWWSARQVERVKRERALWSEQHAKDREQDDAKIADLDATVQWLSGELQDMRRRERLRDQQAREHTAWDNVVVRQLQAAGLTVDDPPPLYLDLAPLHIPEEGS